MRRLAAVVLAGGRGQRFGAAKQLALLDGRPLVTHVTRVILAAGPALPARGAIMDGVIVVLGFHADEVERVLADAIAGPDAPAVRTVRNPDPGRGIASSLQVGLAAIAPGVDAALVALGDQPRLTVGTIETLVEGWVDATAAPPPSICVPRYARGGGPNPVLVDRGAWPLAEALTGDTGLRPVIAAHPELVRVIGIPGSNPDVDTPDDLEALQSDVTGMR
jgi:molybdenum cofactor cytidylyltransferase